MNENSLVHFILKLSSCCSKIIEFAGSEYSEIEIFAIFWNFYSITRVFLLKQENIKKGINKTRSICIAIIDIMLVTEGNEPHWFISVYIGTEKEQTTEIYIEKVSKSKW